MKTKELSTFPDEFMKTKEIDNKRRSKRAAANREWRVGKPLEASGE
jgi:hypothetical protein